MTWLITCEEASDICEVLASVYPEEVAVVLDKLRQGQIDGANFFNTIAKCGCLLGTLAAARAGEEIFDDIVNVWPREVIADAIGMGRFWARPAEDAFRWITPGMTPDNSPRAEEVEGVIVELILSNPKHFRGVKP